MNFCMVADCGKPVRSSGSPYCMMHYHRLYRHGTLEKIRSRKEKLMHSAGYILLYAPGHPLTKRLAGDYEYEHRIVYHDAHGAGSFDCHWCGKEVTWDTLHIDHLDDDKKNNQTNNLVASCPLCNQARGHGKIRGTHRAKGRLLTLGTRTMCVSEWSKEIGISRYALCLRIKKGISVEDALTKPRGKTGPKPKVA